MPYKLKLLAVLVLAAIAAATAIVAAQPWGSEYGEFMDWHDAACVDARDKKAAKSWTEEMLAEQL
jgi:hypothetical protein